MNIEIKRVRFSPLSTEGELWVDGQLECFTLEPSKDKPYWPGHPLVAAGGPYPVELTFSPRLKYVCPEVFNVPNRSDIRGHVGNWPKDTEGCFLVGMAKVEDMVLESKVAFEKLMTLLKTANSITITYTEVSP